MSQQLNLRSIKYEKCMKCKIQENHLQYMYNKGSNDVTDERTRRSLGFKQETNPK